MDLLNIAACIGVVLLHVSNPSLVHFEETSVSFYWGAITHSIALWPVPVFLMLSGSNLIGKHNYTSWEEVKIFYKRRAERTLIPFIAWSIIYAILFHPRMDIREYISTFINGHFNFHMWFFIPLFALYLSMPFLNSVVRNMNSTTEKIYFCLVFLFISLLPFVSSLLDIKYLDYSMFPFGESFFCYAVLGYLITHNSFLHNWRKKIYILSVVAIVLSIITISVALPAGISCSVVANYTSPFCLFTSLAVFLLFKNTDWTSIISRLRISQLTISKISSCSLGVYLIHGSIRTFSNRYDLVITNPYIGTILLYLLSLLIIIAMKRIPVVRKIVP